MNLLVSLLIILLTSTASFAEQWICFNPTTKYVESTIEGDGMVLGICGLNNSNIRSDCILATKLEYDKAKQAYQKVDTSIVTGSRVIDLTQAEKDAVIQVEATAQKQIRDQILADEDTNLTKDLSSINLLKVDQAIDNIGSLTDAKAFLKNLVRYLVGQRIFP